MLKYFDVAETLSEFPDEITLCINISNCPCHCKGCHSPLLQQECEYAESNEEILNKIIEYTNRADTNKLVFLGGDPLYSKNLELTTYLVNELNKS